MKLGEAVYKSQQKPEAKAQVTKIIISQMKKIML